MMSTATTILRRRWRLAIGGTVQGVGFRPFIYQLAQRYQLVGWILNNADGVLLEVEGNKTDLELFASAIHCEAPPLARVAEVTCDEIPLQGDASFQIHLSEGGVHVRAGIPPDVATCAECNADITATDNRRFRYPFTNCTNCGPRFTIITALPYDRPNTTMRDFTMCPACRAEYETPLNRRFHAQPNACPICGPHLCLDGRHELDDSASISATVALLRAGRILAIKGLGGYHLACDARNNAAVHTLRARKGRADKPFALMVATMDSARQLCEISADATAILNAYERPIVLLPARPHNGIAPDVAPGLSTLGLMLPYTPLHQLLLAEFDAPLVMSSANLSDEPIAFCDDEARARLSRIADHFLIHNRPIHMACDDSVVRPYAGTPLLIRRARGYVPVPLALNTDTDLPPILACGGDLKNTFCLTKGKTALLSQHMGDLGNAATLEHYRRAVRHFCDFYAVEPQAIAHDLHPDYHATRYALSIDGVPHIGVQHHHAHIAACMAEHQLSGQVIGVAYDGTGYGSDGTIWGGEVLIADYRNFRRAGHLRPFHLPGGEAAIRKPARIMLGLLQQLGLTPEESTLLLPGASDEECRIIPQQIARGINALITTSMGRLFDAVSALLDCCREVTYEGQAAIQLEVMSDASPCGVYPYDIDRNCSCAWECNYLPILAGLLDGLRDGEVPATLAARFHMTIAEMTVALCCRLRDETGLNRVALSGGVFQNLLLLTWLQDGLTRDGFEVYRHEKVPCNDGSISLGQAVIAVARLKG